MENQVQQAIQEVVDQLIPQGNPIQQPAPQLPQEPSQEEKEQERLKLEQQKKHVQELKQIQQLKRKIEEKKQAMDSKQKKLSEMQVEREKKESNLRSQENSLISMLDVTRNNIQQLRIQVAQHSSSIKQSINKSYALEQNKSRLTSDLQKLEQSLLNKHHKIQALQSSSQEKQNQPFTEGLAQLQKRSQSQISALEEQLQSLKSRWSKSEWKGSSKAGKSSEQANIQKLKAQLQKAKKKYRVIEQQYISVKNQCQNQQQQTLFLQKKLAEASSFESLSKVEEEIRQNRLVQKDLLQKIQKAQLSSQRISQIAKRQKQIETRMQVANEQILVKQRICEEYSKNTSGLKAEIERTEVSCQDLKKMLAKEIVQQPATEQAQKKKQKKKKNKKEKQILKAHEILVQNARNEIPADRPPQASGKQVLQRKEQEESSSNTKVYLLLSVGILAVLTAYLLK